MPRKNLGAVYGGYKFSDLAEYKRLTTQIRETAELCQKTVIPAFAAGGVGAGAVPGGLVLEMVLVTAISVAVDEIFEGHIDMEDGLGKCEEAVEGTIIENVQEFIQDEIKGQWEGKSKAVKAAREAAEKLFESFTKRIEEMLGETFLKKIFARNSAAAAAGQATDWIPGFGEIAGAIAGAVFAALTCNDLINENRASYQASLDNFAAETDKVTLQALVDNVGHDAAYFEFYGFLALPGIAGDWHNVTVGCDAPGGFIYLVTGQVTGCNGGGDIHRVNKKTGQYTTLKESKGEWMWATTMTYCKGSLYIVCGKMGCYGDKHGTGGLYKVNKDTGSYHRIGESKTEWEYATTMTSCGNYLYITCGKMGGCKGLGGLYKVNKDTGNFDQLGPDLDTEWRYATTMTSCGDHLYITCGKMGRCSGLGGLFKVNKDTGKFEQLGPDLDREWANATTMTSSGGLLYITCGVMGGCKGDGGLFEVNPDNGDFRRLGYLYEWDTATVMVGGEDGVFIVCGERGGCHGSGTIYKAKINYNSALIRSKL